MQTTVNERIKILYDGTGLSVRKFAAQAGVTDTSMHRILEGSNNPSFELLTALIGSYPNISTDWLIKGEGDMYKIENTQPVTEQAVIEMRNQLKIKDTQIERLINMLELSFKGAQLSKFNGNGYPLGSSAIIARA